MSWISHPFPAESTRIGRSRLATAPDVASGSARCPAPVSPPCRARETGSPHRLAENHAIEVLWRARPRYGDRPGFPVSGGATSMRAGGGRGAVRRGRRQRRPRPEGPRRHLAAQRTGGQAPGCFCRTAPGAPSGDGGPSPRRGVYPRPELSRAIGESKWSSIDDLPRPVTRDSRSPPHRIIDDSWIVGRRRWGASPWGWTGWRGERVPGRQPG